MVITDSLARGLVREAVAVQSRRARRAWEELNRARTPVPDSLRGFGKWFREQQRIFQSKAILIAYGTVGRRRGTFSSFMPAFVEAPRGWVLEIDRLTVAFTPGRLERLELERLPVTICGHALERIFQRVQTLRWTEVRDCLAGAVIFAAAAVEPYVSGGFRQCALPAERGLLVGQVERDRLSLNTFLPADDLNPKWAALLRDFRALLETQSQAFHVAAASASADPAHLVSECLQRERHRWLRMPYVPSADPMEDAWDARPVETAA